MSVSEPSVVERSLSCLAPGATLAGKYRLSRKLGAGGMCVVYEAEHVGLKQPVAVKVLKAELADDKDCVARFEREARSAAQLRNPNVARVFDVDWLPTGQPYITMELLLGQDLAQELTAKGKLPSEEAVDYVRQACAGISEAHALGIVHRDVKPENLFLADLGELTDRKMVKLLDFGIAKTLSDEARRLTAPDAVFGTVDYMSPEQIRSAATVDHRSDIWSLGVILYELVTGRTPYHGDARSVIAQIVTDPVRPPTALLPDLPPSFVGVVMKALSKDVAKRYQSATELAEALEPFMTLEPITSVLARLPPESMPRRTSTRPPKNSERQNARTNTAWESHPPRRERQSRAWIAALAVPVVLAGSAALVLKLRPQWLASFTGRTAVATTAEGASATTALASLPAPVASATPIASATPPVVTATPTPTADDPAPTASASPSTAKSKKRPPPPSHAAPAKSAAPPPPPPATPATATQWIPPRL